MAAKFLQAVAEASTDIGSLAVPTLPPSRTNGGALGMENWRDRCRGKLMSVEEAVARVSPGDIVAVAPFTCTPHTLCHGLMARIRGRRAA